MARYQLFMTHSHHSPSTFRVSRFGASQVELPQLREELRHRGMLRGGGAITRLEKDEATEVLGAPILIGYSEKQIYIYIVYIDSVYK